MCETGCSIDLVKNVVITFTDFVCLCLFIVFVFAIADCFVSSVADEPIGGLFALGGWRVGCLRRLGGALGIHLRGAEPVNAQRGFLGVEADGAYLPVVLDRLD
jgi:hypothetical protein